MLYPQLTGCYWLARSQLVCFLGRGGEWKTDYDEKKRNTAGSGFLHIFDKIDARTFF
jgi:hypothetical protein